MFDAHRPLVEAYRVVDVRSPTGDPAPPEVAERFEGRLYTLHQLEQRGIRIQGRTAWYLFSGQDWQLKLEPAV
jgi:hypothetical protein